MPKRYERWRPRIEAAASIDQLLLVTREYCALFLPSDLAKLPASMPNMTVAIPGDVQNLAVELSILELKTPPDSEAHETLHEATLVFRAAAEKLKNLYRP